MRSLESREIVHESEAVFSNSKNTLQRNSTVQIFEKKLKALFKIFVLNGQAQLNSNNQFTHHNFLLSKLKYLTIEIPNSSGNLLVSNIPWQYGTEIVKTSSPVHFYFLSCKRLAWHILSLSQVILLHESTPVVKAICQQLYTYLLLMQLMAGSPRASIDPICVSLLNQRKKLWKRYCNTSRQSILFLLASYTVCPGWLLMLMNLLCRIFCIIYCLSFQSCFILALAQVACIGSWRNFSVKAKFERWNREYKRPCREWGGGNFKSRLLEHSTLWVFDQFVHQRTGNSDWLRAVNTSIKCQMIFQGKTLLRLFRPKHFFQGKTFLRL